MLATVEHEVTKLMRIQRIDLPPDLFTGVAPKHLDAYRQRIAAEELHEVRRHPDPVRYTLLAAFCWLRSRELTDTLGELLMDMIHHLGTKAERKVEKAFLQDLKRVSGKTNLLFQLAEAAVEHPDGIVREVLFHLGTAKADAILRRFTRHGLQHPTYQAMVELGKVYKTIFLCQYLNDISLRREIHEGLNVIENWNSANSFIFYGKGSEFASNHQDDQEVTMLCLHLLQLSLAYINTLLIQRLLQEPQWTNCLTPDDHRALTRLIYSHVNPYGLIRLYMTHRIPIDETEAA